MENEPNELFNLSKGMPLKDAPLIYMHEEFKKENKKHGNLLKNNWVWFSKEDIQAISDMIKKLDEPTKMISGDGVRLYYGIYNEKVCDYLMKLPRTEKNADTDYSLHNGHNTVFFVPTYKIEGGVNCMDDITPADVTINRRNYDANIDISDSAILKGGGGYDVGNICPPPPINHEDCSKSGSNL